MREFCLRIRFICRLKYTITATVELCLCVRDVYKRQEFLKTYRSEVTKSMQLNYEFDRQLELERADAIEEGLEQGLEQGIESVSYTHLDVYKRQRSI